MQNFGRRPDRSSAPGGPPVMTRSPERVRYFDEKMNLREALVDEEAEAEAKRIEAMSHSQLRRYYGEVLAIRRRLEHESNNRVNVSRAEVFAALRPEFKMLRAKAYYANGRDRRTFPNEMKEFIEKHVASVSTDRDFDAFCRHFEAVVAFHKVYGKDRR